LQHFENCGPNGERHGAGEKVTLRNMDVAQLDGMTEFTNDNNAFRELDDTQQINLTQQ
jgi:hypothetical protein